MRPVAVDTTNHGPRAAQPSRLLAEHRPAPLLHFRCNHRLTVPRLLSFTPARKLEGAAASKVGSAFLYILVATIGMKMDITAVFTEWQLFVVGGVWISIHAALLLIVARLIRAPTFFLAVGSQANIGGAASAPIMAAACHPALAPVGVMLAVLGYALGTYMAAAAMSPSRRYATTSGFARGRWTSCGRTPGLAGSGP